MIAIIAITVRISIKVKARFIWTVRLLAMEHGTF